MSLSTAPDISTLIIVPSSDPSSTTPTVSTERRLHPSWPISMLKTRLEPITGIPSLSQLLRLQTLSNSASNIWTLLSDDDKLLGDYGLTKGSVIEVVDTRPRGAQTDWNDVNKVEKYVMPEAEYEKRDDTVLAWKKRAGLGRFDASAKTKEEMAEERRAKDGREIEERRVKVGIRCRVSKDNGKRGVVKWLGEVEGLGGEREKGCVWVGVELDEPVGRNDGSVEVEVVGKDGKGKEVKRLWEGREKYGVLVRPEKVEVGEEWTVVDDLMDEDMEEI